MDTIIFIIIINIINLYLSTVRSLMLLSCISVNVTLATDCDDVFSAFFSFRAVLKDTLLA